MLLRPSLQHALFTTVYPLVNLCGWLQKCQTQEPITFTTVAYSSYLIIIKGSRPTALSNFTIIQAYMALT